ncbi:hypothetical protein EJ03DRAFT_349519 [Teratosphaeria nubilosa]|uniref:Uncharacterized protein n=1 Tax=Teratosphaeria nubilosa TaxID=161662 RepID=A0A6G1LF66_9PEZI|nr:hypothetical protein EJ03DRAFT_349519 [Teratosphaeria nubilosa]
MGCPSASGTSNFTSTSQATSSSATLPRLLWIDSQTTKYDKESHKSSNTNLGRHHSEYSEGAKLKMSLQVLYSMVPEAPGGLTRALTIAEATQLVAQDKHVRNHLNDWMGLTIEQAAAMDGQVGADYPTRFEHGRDKPFGLLWSFWANPLAFFDSLLEGDEPLLLGNTDYL